MMKVSIVVAAVALLASPALGFNMEVGMKSSLTFDIEAAKNRPVSKVITLSCLISTQNTNYETLFGYFLRTLCFIVNVFQWSSRISGL